MDKELIDMVVRSKSILETIKAVRGENYAGLVSSYAQLVAFDIVMRQADAPPILNKTYNMLMEGMYASIVCVLADKEGKPEEAMAEEIAKDVKAILGAIVQKA